jgi:alpha-tubulin suppressor-like RCC1 family protein
MTPLFRSAVAAFIFATGSSVAWSEAVSTGAAHTLVRTPSGVVWAWGQNTNGQLGTGNTTRMLTPTKVKGLPEGIVSVTAGASHSAALTSGGSVWTWGKNSHGQLGNGSTLDSAVPVAVQFATAERAA